MVWPGRVRPGTRARGGRIPRRAWVTSSCTMVLARAICLIWGLLEDPLVHQCRDACSYPASQFSARWTHRRLGRRSSRHDSGGTGSRDRSRVPWHASIRALRIGSGEILLNPVACIRVGARPRHRPVDRPPPSGKLLADMSAGGFGFRARSCPRERYRVCSGSHCRLNSLSLRGLDPGRHDGVRAHVEKIRGFGLPPLLLSRSPTAGAGPVRGAAHRRTSGSK